MTLAVASPLPLEAAVEGRRWDLDHLVHVARSPFPVARPVRWGSTIHRSGPACGLSLLVATASSLRTAGVREGAPGDPPFSTASHEKNNAFSPLCRPLLCMVRTNPDRRALLRTAAVSTVGASALTGSALANDQRDCSNAEDTSDGCEGPSAPCDYP